MQTTCIGEKRNSNQQEMGETREPMARDCWDDANRLANLYAKKMNRDFWILFAAKQHTHIKTGAVMGWEVIAKRPPQAMLGVLVFKWVHNDQRLMVEADLSLPYDIPLSDAELSSNPKDFIPSVAETAKMNKNIILFA